jgi:N-acetylmuramoyl-L-alanine amidase CwlA
MVKSNITIENKGLSIEAFKQHVAGLKLSWKPKFVVIHHTAAPSLAQRPNGFTEQHMRNIESFYEEKGWSAGPHLFIDDDQVWLFSTLEKKGVHAVAFNVNGIGIEMLGNYDVEDPKSGRGYLIITNTAKAVAILLKKLGLTNDSIRFHRDDPNTSKTCPGTKVEKSWFINEVKKYYV